MAKKRRVALMLDLNWPYEWHHGIFVGAQRYAKEQGWDTIIDETLDPNNKYDGIIARTTQEIFDLANKHHTPLVNVMFGSAVRDKVPSVVPDYTIGGRIRAEHLLERGFYNFAALAGANIGGQIALAEFMRVISRAGFPCISARVPTRNPSEKEKWKLTETIIDDWMNRWQFPIAVYLDPALTARIIVQKCHVRGWRIPDDVGIICGENDKLICEEPAPSISRIDIGFDRIGYQAAEFLNKLMNERQHGNKKKTAAHPPQILVPPREVIVRESTDIYCVRDDLVASALDYISSHINRRLSQDNVAEALSVGLKTLQNHFRKTLNRPIATVIRHMRIDRAKRALLQGDRSMASIARDTGFITPERMNEVFRREIGMSPTAFRAMHS